MKQYDNNSIRQRKGADRIRKAPAAMLGSNGLDGAKHTVIEIIGNATDEKLSGYGDKLDLALYEDGSISVRDYGRGVPMGWNDVEKKWNYFLIYEELFAGGKYDKNQDILKKIDEENGWDNFKLTDYPYLISIGLNGLGAAATQFSSEFCTVISYRGGKASRMEFQKGYHVLEELEVTDTDEPNGTFIRWKPDNEVFTDINIPAKWLDRLCMSLSYVAGFNVTFDNKGTIKEYPKSDIYDVMQESTGDCVRVHNFTHTVDGTGDICICDASVAIGPKGRGNEYYHNMVEVSGGSHSTAVSYAVSRFFFDVSHKYGVRIRESDYAGKFSFIISSLANKMSPRGQTKDSVDDGYVTENLQDCMYKALYQEWEKGTDWLVKVINSTVEDAHNRIQIAEMSKSLREVEKVTKSLKASNKFISCAAYEKKQYSGLELFIVEGDSAGGRAMTARDSKFQCILQIRGKSLNLYKAPLDKLIANKEVQDLIAALGCGVELGIDEYQSFDINKLRFDKIIILADADVDGEHINMIEFVKIFKLFPELLYQGKVYIAVTPLYCITTKDDQQVYCMTQSEMEAKREEIGEGNIASVDRFKGHGETTAEGLWNTSMNPDTRTLKQINIEKGDTDIWDTLEVLFGRSTESRKRAILGELMGTSYDETVDDMESVSEYIDSLDLSEVEVEEITY